MNIPPQQFPAALRKIRKARQLTLDQMRQTFGVSRREYTRWENGESAPARKHWGLIDKLAKEIGVE